MSPQSEPRTIAWCGWHKGLSDTARFVRAPADPGHGAPGLFACAACRLKYGLTPLGDQP